MRITTITVGVTFNKGNFQSARFDVTGEVGDGEQPAAVALSLWSFAVSQGRRVALDANPAALLAEAAGSQGRWEPPDGIAKWGAGDFTERCVEDFSVQGRSE